MRTKLLQGKGSGTLLLSEGRKGISASRTKAAYPMKTCPSKSRGLPAQGQKRHRQAYNQEQRHCANCPVWTSGDVCPSSLPSLSDASREEVTPHHSTFVCSDALGSSPRSGVSANAAVCGRCCPQHAFLSFHVTMGMPVSRGRRWDLCSS